MPGSNPQLGGQECLSHVKLACIHRCDSSPACDRRYWHTVCLAVVTSSIASSHVSSSLPKPAHRTRNMIWSSSLKPQSTISSIVKASSSRCTDSEGVDYSAALAAYSVSRKLTTSGTSVWRILHVIITLFEFLFIGQCPVQVYCPVFSPSLSHLFF